MNTVKSILLVSCYELGHQPAGIAMPLAFLQRAGYSVETMDVSVEGFDADKVRRARFVGISVPMHTALRLGLRVAEEIRKLNPRCHMCFYGLYASLNAEYLLATVADAVIGGEFEEALVELIKRVQGQTEVTRNQAKAQRSDSKPVRERLNPPVLERLNSPVLGRLNSPVLERLNIPVLEKLDPPVLERLNSPVLGRLNSPVLERLNFPVPDRSSLVPLERYARLEYNGEQRLVGYVEASRGCLHQCTHCPIPPVYDGRFFVVPQEVVLEDIRRLVASGARHITFGDPDFLNGPGHSIRIARAMHEEFPDLTFDFTAKIEHILKYRELIPELAQSGCVFAVSAVESLSDTVLEHLEKGHTRDDVSEALRILRDAGISMRPSLVPFTPWATVDDYIDILEFVESEGLIDHVDPVQYSIRLLIPPGSLLLSQPDSHRWLGRLVQESFTYEWTHPDSRMDELHKQVSAVVEQAANTNEDAAETFYKIRESAYASRGDEPPVGGALPIVLTRLRPPRLTEAWFC